MNEFVNVAMYVGADSEAHMRFDELYKTHFQGKVVLPEGQLKEQINVYVPESFLSRFIAILDSQEEFLVRAMNVYKDGERIRSHDKIPCSLLELKLTYSKKPREQFEAELEHFAPGSVILEEEDDKIYVRVPKNQADDYVFMLQHTLPEISLVTKVA